MSLYFSLLKYQSWNYQWNYWESEVVMQSGIMAEVGGIMATGIWTQSVIHDDDLVRQTIFFDPLT